MRSSAMVSQVSVESLSHLDTSPSTHRLLLGLCLPNNYAHTINSFIQVPNLAVYFYSSLLNRVINWVVGLLFSLHVRPEKPEQESTRLGEMAKISLWSYRQHAWVFSFPVFEFELAKILDKHMSLTFLHSRVV